MNTAPKHEDKSAEARNQAGPGASAPQVPESGADLRSELISALTGKDANRDRAVAHRTRRVVLSSHGVLQEQRQDKSRARSVALAVTLVVLLLMAPLVWEVTDSLVAGEHLGDPRNQWSLWALILCPTLLGAGLIAGWLRRRP